MDNFKDFIRQSESIYILKTDNVSENLKYHIDNNLPITENVFRPGSNSFLDIIKEVRDLFDNKLLEIQGEDKYLFEHTDLGKFGFFEGKMVPLDLPSEESLYDEADYHGKNVELNKPSRSSGPKKYKVYVMNSKTGKVKLVNFGDVKGGLTSKVNNPKARKAFAQRHNCKEKIGKADAKLTPGYWSCVLPRYKNLVKTNFSGFW